MTRIVWISGASSGIGAACARATPYADARVIGISRRASAHGETLTADLAAPSSWGVVADQFRDVLAASPEHAVFFHCAGTNHPIGPLAEVDGPAYARAVLLNSAAGQILGQAFISACVGASVPGTLILCSSPAAAIPAPGLTHYSAGKAGIEQWVRSAAQEQGQTGAVSVWGVVPWAVDTEMVRASGESPRDDVPITLMLHDAIEREELASPDSVAAEIWAAFLQGVTPGTFVHVGAVNAHGESDEPGVRTQEASRP